MEIQLFLLEGDRPMWKHAARINLATFVMFLALALGLAETAPAQIVGRTLALGRQTGTLALSDLKGRLCRSVAAAECPSCENPETFLPIDPHLDLMRIPDDDGAGGNGREFPATFWHVVSLQAQNGYRVAQIQPLASCEKTTVVTECGRFDVKLYWNSGDGSGRSHLVLLDGSDDLHGELTYDLQLVATPRGSNGTAFALNRQLRFQLNGTWSATPGSDAYAVGQPFSYDSDCNGTVDRVAQPTATGLYLGWTATGHTSAVCSVGTDHSADFCWAPARDEAESQFD
jgi:hypothetical protein